TVRVRGFVSSPHEPVTLRSPYSDRASAALRRIDGPTTLPTITMQAPVYVSGTAVRPDGTNHHVATAELYERDPAGHVVYRGFTSMAASGYFQFSGLAFRGIHALRAQRGGRPGPAVAERRRHHHLPVDAQRRVHRRGDRPAVLAHHGGPQHLHLGVCGAPCP